MVRERGSGNQKPLLRDSLELQNARIRDDLGDAELGMAGVVGGGVVVVWRPFSTYQRSNNKFG